MKLIKYPLLAALFGAAAILTSQAQGFDTGSTGADGALNLTDADQTIQLPPNGRLNYSSINIPGGRTLRFIKNALNTPVYLLSQGDVIIDGVIDIQGSVGPGNPPIGGPSGPGGFDGGKPGFGNGFPPGDGYGPGAGGAGDNGKGPTSAGGGGYATPGDQAPIAGTSQFNGQTYGSALLIPLIGGSGGGGTVGVPGIGGGEVGGHCWLPQTPKFGSAAPV